MMLHERVRPSTLDGVIGQDQAVSICRRLATLGLGSTAIWLSGDTGTGKTTIARALAAEHAAPWNIVEVDSQWLTPSRARELEEGASYAGLPDERGKLGRCWIINEAHLLRPETVRHFLTLLERLPRHLLVLFTVTTDGQASLFGGDMKGEGSQLHARCVPIALAKRGTAESYAQHALEIARKEGLDGGATLDRVVRLVRDNRGSLRATLSAIEGGILLSE